jgi:hypothetical protein
MPLDSMLVYFGGVLDCVEWVMVVLWGQLVEYVLVGLEKHQSGVEEYFEAADGILLVALAPLEVVLWSEDDTKDALGEDW